MKIKSKLIILLFLIFIFISVTVIAGQLEVHYPDVGQADSVLIQLPNSQTMLIDAGNNADGNFVVNYIKKRGISKIDYLIGTHPHEDHIGGLDNVIESFNIGKIYMPQVTTNTRTFKDVLLAIKNKGVKITAPIPGMYLINIDNLKAEIIAPNGSGYNDLNNYSIVIKLTYGKTSFLFTGDAEDISEEQMLSEGYNLKADVLKVGHHGSDSSTSDAFLKAVSPQYAVISVGKDNDYGHPAPVTIDKLKRHNVKIFRTDEQGTITCISDGNNITFNIAPTNNISFSDSSSSITTFHVIISAVDLKGELVVIKNNGNKAIDISGWKLLSVKGNQSFIFPPGTILKAGGIIKVDSGKGAHSGPGQLKWTGKYIWNNDGDPAGLLMEAAS